MHYQEIWIKAGTYAKRKYIPVWEVHTNLPRGCEQALLPFHALTGSDTTSYIRNHPKVSAWKQFILHHALLKELGEGHLTEKKLADAENFVCRLYNHGNVTSVNQIRQMMFLTIDKAELMPPTQDALQQHLMRVHFQSMVWKQAITPIPVLPNPVDMGWKLHNGELKPMLMTIDAIPMTCTNIVFCKCKKLYKTRQCSCRYNNNLCAASCRCCSGHIPCSNRSPD